MQIIVSFFSFRIQTLVWIDEYQTALLTLKILALLIFKKVVSALILA
ncbi:hypothetical protein VCHENC01_2718 [Vibrio harveyi]|nr:hypothetical protein VCHENC01_2718 [Vibrio harveyi]MCV3262317.1 hypothetical protein [Vibrio harveyi]